MKSLPPHRAQQISSKREDDEDLGCRAFAPCKTARRAEWGIGRVSQITIFLVGRMAVCSKRCTQAKALSIYKGDFRRFFRLLRDIILH
jgi:hypothetical protein